MKFEWDKNKNKRNKNKHSVSFDDAIYVFSDKFNLTIYDVSHSLNEERYITIGQITNGKMLIVVHTVRGLGSDKAIRIISARKATRNEVNQYIERKK